MDLYFGAVYDSHPWRPDLVGGAVSEVIQVSSYSRGVESVAQFQRRTSERAVTAHLVQCVSVRSIVTSVTGLVQ